MITKLDHLALRLINKEEASKVLNLFGYILEDKFELDFGESGKAESYVMSSYKTPEIFMSDGDKDTVIGEWVDKHGPGIHHVALVSDNIYNDVADLKAKGIEFTTPDVLVCDDLKQIFTKPIDCLGGLIIELIERKTKGFCAGNVKAIMDSTKGL
jgi:4-hydroxyphenylpyruvate dioxygenase-like putative hemolysin